MSHPQHNVYRRFQPLQGALGCGGIVILPHLFPTILAIENACSTVVLGQEKGYGVLSYPCRGVKSINNLDEALSSN